MKHSEKIYIVKQAFGLGSPIGGLYGLSKAPEGEKAEGLLHGLLRGLGIDVGGGLGALGGYGASKILDPYGRKPPPGHIKLQTLDDALRGAQKSILRGTRGALIGGGLGALGGYKLMDKFMGKTPYEE